MFGCAKLSWTSICSAIGGEAVARTGDAREVGLTMLESRDSGDVGVRS